ncbi:MAG: TonB-dependent receptor [Chitinophagaceae bacterium]|nr:TonB-dependent receptor [Chitinophagaceae bacterium]
MLLLSRAIGKALPLIIYTFLFFRPAAICQEKLSSLSAKVNYTARTVKAADLLDALHKQTGYNFLFERTVFSGISLENIRFEDISLGAALESLQKTHGFLFSVAGKNIAVKPAPVLKPASSHSSLIRITGQVRDMETRELLRGVNIVLKGAGGATNTDEDGKFSIEAPASGAVLVFTMVGYISQSRTVSAATQELNILLAHDTKSLTGVMVQARKKANTEAALLNERKTAAIVTDGISAQNIEKTASITTTQALQRVTGVTITDEKYVAIRGLGDRSVIAELNGARLSSANPDRSAVPLDLVPASLLDNITVYKTASPDHPADASAGIIELKTKSVPSVFTVQFTGQSGVNTSIGFGGKVNSFQGGDMGFWGQKIKQKDLSPDFLKLKDQYPGGLVEIQRLFIESRTDPARAAEAYRINAIMQSFDPVLSTSYRKAQVNQIYTVSMGNTFHIFGNHALGVILSANYYRRTEDRYNAELNQYSLYQGVVTGGFTSNYINGVPYYTPKIYSPLHIPAFISPDNPRLGKYLGYKENTGTETVSYGALAGVTYRINQANEVQLQYIGSRGGETSGSNLNGTYQNTGLQFPVYDRVNQLRQTYRIFNTFNFQGEHKLQFGNGNAWPQLSYNLSSSKSKQDEPDFRFTDLADLYALRNVDANGVGIGSNTYSFVVGSVHGIGPNGVIGADPNGRKYRNLDETNYNAKGDLTERVEIGGLTQTFKTGFNYLHRKRVFTESILGIPGTNSGGDDGLLDKVNGNIDQLVSYANVGLKDAGTYDNLGQPRVGGFLYQIKKSPNNYSGIFETKAFYGMVDLFLRSDLRLTGGVRFETTDIETTVDTVNVYDPLAVIHGGCLSTGDVVTSGTVNNPHIVYSHNYAPYYSGNLTYTFQKDMNFRLGFNTSLARPELREMTNIYEFDPFQFAVVVGNPNLINQLTRSEDFRWEWFPHPGEVLSASLFAKQIDHQLTKVFIYNAPGNQSLYPEYPIVEFQNDPNKGNIYGIELEVRKDLGRYLPQLKYFHVGVNFMGAYSEITKNPARLDASRINDRHAPAKSPVFEQPPYSLNAYLDFDYPRCGTSATLSFNVVGERLVQVQLDGTPDIYDRPAPMLDFVFSQRLGKRFLVKGFAKNILDPAFREVYAYPSNGGKFNGQTYIHHQYHKGTELALGLTYNLF